MTNIFTDLNKKSPNWFRSIKYFRIGRFDEAGEEVQKSWYFFVGKIMPCINKEWNDEAIKLTSLLSKYTTPSDEALALTAIEKKIESWLLTNKDDEEGLLESERGKQAKKHSRDIWTDDDIDKFYQTQVDVTKKRNDAICGENWDSGYQQYLRKIIEPRKSTIQKNNNLLKEAFMDDNLESSTVSSFKDTQTQSAEKTPKNDTTNTNYDIQNNYSDDDE